MLSFAQGLAEVAHWAPLVPLAVVGWRWSQRRTPSAVAILFAAAFAISIVADSASTVLAPANTWWLGYLWAPLQFGLLIAILVPSKAGRTVLIGLLASLAAVSALKGPLTMPETLIQAIGGLLVSWLIWGNEEASRYRRAVWCYCLGTLPGLVWMAAVPTNDPRWLWGWTGYQVVRLAALGYLAWSIGGEDGTESAARSDRQARADSRLVIGLDSRAMAAPEARLVAGLRRLTLHRDPARTSRRDDVGAAGSRETGESVPHGGRDGRSATGG